MTVDYDNAGTGAVASRTAMAVQRAAVISRMAIRAALKQRVAIELVLVHRKVRAPAAIIVRGR